MAEKVSKESYVERWARENLKGGEVKNDRKEERNLDADKGVRRIVRGKQSRKNKDSETKDENE